MGAQPLRAFLVAGEASGDALGAALMDGLARLAPGVAFAGVGGPLMEARGLRSLFPMDELSVMGLAEVLPRYPALRRRMVQTAAAAIAARPDVLVTIDAPAFGLRVARRVRAALAGRCASSTTSRPRFGRGGRAGPRRCAAWSIWCSPSCRSSRR